MSSDGGDWEAQVELSERPFGARPFGARPFGARGDDERPFGARPFGARPFGARGDDERPFGARPFGARPFGARPFGARPFGARGGDGGGFLDSEEWGADITDLVCERSAVIRLGATLVAGDQELPVAPFNPATGIRAPGAAGPVPGAPDPLLRALRPGDWRLEAGVAVTPQLRRGLCSSPELIYALKLDLAEELALRADQTFLQGAGPPAEPLGIAGLVQAIPPGEDVLDTARRLITALRPAIRPPPFRNPGWILAPNTLDALAMLLTADGLVAGGERRSLDSYRLLWPDGRDGGVFLGFPFVTSAEAGQNVFFAADWQEAWIGVDSSFVSVHVSTEAPPPDPGEGTVIRASMPFDFALRKIAAFALA